METEWTLKKLSNVSLSEKEAFSGQAKIIVKDVQLIEAKTKLEQLTQTRGDIEVCTLKLNKLKESLQAQLKSIVSEYKAKYTVIKNLIDLVVGSDKSHSHRSTMKSPRPKIDVSMPSPRTAIAPASAH